MKDSKFICICTCICTLVRIQDEGGYFQPIRSGRLRIGHVRIAPRLSGQNCKFFKYFLSLNSQRKLRKQHQIQNFYLKASEPCQNIYISNVAYLRWRRPRKWSHVGKQHRGGPWVDFHGDKNVTQLQNRFLVSCGPKRSQSIMRQWPHREPIGTN